VELVLNCRLTAVNQKLQKLLIVEARGRLSMQYGT